MVSISADSGDWWGGGISLAASVHERHSPAKLIGLVIGFGAPPRCSEITSKSWDSLGGPSMVDVRNGSK